MKNVFLLLCLSLLPFGLTAQSTPRSSIGIEFQAYPTGLIPGLAGSWYLSPKDALRFRIGYQFIDHRDLGVQDDETGTGFGGTMGYRRHFQSVRKGIFGGLRCDLWRNRIDWIDFDGDTAIMLASGTSNVWVVQPTAEIGYNFSFGQWAFAPALAFGYEVNVATDGAPTGEGSILLIGIALDYFW